MFLFILFFIINIVISVINAVSVGRNWTKVKSTRGMVKWSAYSVFTMSVLGFTQTYMIILLFLSPHILPLFGIYGMSQYVVQMLFVDISFILIGMAVIPTGLLMWYQSALHFWKRKNFGNGATLAWNTFAQARNTVAVARGIPQSMRRIRENLSKQLESKNGVVIAIALISVAVIVLGGYFTTLAIVKKVDRI